jgi:hypothetical protein
MQPIKLPIIRAKGSVKFPKKNFERIFFKMNAQITASSVLPVAITKIPVDASPVVKLVMHEPIKMAGEKRNPNIRIIAIAIPLGAQNGEVLLLIEASFRLRIPAQAWSSMIKSHNPILYSFPCIDWILENIKNKGLIGMFSAIYKV